MEMVLVEYLPPSPITLLLQRRSRPIREGSPPPLTPLLLQLLKLLPPPQPSSFFVFWSSKVDAVEMRQVSSASCTRSHLLPDSDGQPTLGKLHPPPQWQQRVAVAAGWRQRRVLGGATSPSPPPALGQLWLGGLPPLLPPSLPLLCGRCRVTNCSRCHPARGGRNMQKCSAKVQKCSAEQFFHQPGIIQLCGSFT